MALARPSTLLAIAWALPWTYLGIALGLGNRGLEHDSQNRIALNRGHFAAQRCQQRGVLPQACGGVEHRL